MDRSNIEKIAHTPEDKLLLAKLWDKIHGGIRRNVLANTGFLTPREQEMARYLFGNLEGLVYFGGYADAERQMLVYVPEYMEESSLLEDDSPLVCLHAQFYEADAPSHRDFLGALMGAGIARETIGDICVGKDSCDFFVTAEMSAFVLQNLLSAGRASLHMQKIPLTALQLPQPETKEIKDTLASVRLDSVISSGFRIGRSLAVQYVHAGKVAIDGLPCERPDKVIPQGAKISVRGLGKIRLTTIGGQTKKGRISVIIDRYI